MKYFEQKQTKGTKGCRVCVCTEDAACRNLCGEACHWVEADLCSACFAGHGAHKLSEAMLRQLKDAAMHGDAGHSLRGRSQHGGSYQVTRALVKRGLFDQADKLTAAGKRVCWDCGFLPYAEVRS